MADLAEQRDAINELGQSVMDPDYVPTPEEAAAQGIGNEEEEEIAEEQDEVVEDEAEPTGDEESQEDDEDAEESEDVDEEEEEGDEDEDEEEESEESEESDEDDFEFTPDADDETFDAEAEAYLESVEITPQLQAILDKQAERIESAQAQLSEREAMMSSEEYATLTEAVEGLVETVQDESGNYVPNTEKFINMLQTDYKKELPNILFDMNTLPSEKYQGLTRVQEMLVDGYQLSPPALLEVQEFLQSGGKGRLMPTYVPAGVNPELTEAWWGLSDSKRESLEIMIEVAQDPDEDELTRQKAKMDLQDELGTLERVQTGLNAEKQRAAAIQQQQADAVAKVEADAELAFTETVTGLQDVLEQELASSLDTVGGDIAAQGLVNAVTTALDVNNDARAAAAQERLRAKGIDFDFKKGRAALDRLYQVDEKIVMLKSDPTTNPKAIQNAERQKVIAVTELKGLQKELLGSMTAKVFKNRDEGVQKRIAKTKKVAAVRKKVKGKGTKTATGKKLGKYDTAGYRQQILEAARKGDMSDLA